ncbi:MAG: TetR/AcrR family transcriptional regulator [Deltaproteobacteria bacterium]|nr:TetR/AcrR family transcriptional regulator [Deltaproteobacteria bacterium]
MSDRRDRRRRQILAAAKEVFAQKGYVATTVDDIVTRIEISRGTFYNYYDDKLDIFEALVESFMAALATSIIPIDLSPGAPTPREQLQANLKRVVELALNDPAMVTISLSTAMGVDPGLDEKLSVFYGHLRVFMDETLQTGQQLGLVRPGDRGPMLSIALGGMEGLLIDAVSGSVDADADELVEAVMSFLESGLLGR